MERDQRVLSQKERQFLHDQQIFTDREDFVQHLKKPTLQRALQINRSDQLPIYAHQQIYFDYKGSVVAKVQQLRNLSRAHFKIHPFFVWIDTDRAASDKLGLRLYWPSSKGKKTLRFAPSKCEQMESRFIRTEPARVRKAIQTLQTWVRQLPKEVRNTAIDRFEQLYHHFQIQENQAEMTLSLTRFLFQQTLGFWPTALRVSELLKCPWLNKFIHCMLNQRSEFIYAINQRIRSLQRLGIDAGLNELPNDYLPLFFSCPEDGARLRLHYERKRGMHFASSILHKGKKYSFSLGENVMTIKSLEKTNRWSPDVGLPILLNDAFSGMIVGRSSAFYMLVFRPVLRDVLKMDAIPMLLPSDFQVFRGSFDSLLYNYLLNESF